MGRDDVRIGGRAPWLFGGIDAPDCCVESHFETKDGIYNNSKVTGFGEKVVRTQEVVPYAFADGISVLYG